MYACRTTFKKSLGSFNSAPNKAVSGGGAPIYSDLEDSAVVEFSFRIFDSQLLKVVPCPHSTLVMTWNSSYLHLYSASLVLCKMRVRKCTSV